jgi:TolA-binding protein
MNFFSKLAILAVFLVSTSHLMSGCVTTRAQLNQERGITEDSDEGAAEETPSKSSVKSEDLSSTPAQPPATVTNPPLTPQAPGGATVSNPPAQPPGPYAPAAGAAASASTGGYNAEELRAEIARLNGKVEELEHEKKLQEEDRANEQKKLQDQVVGLEKQLKESQPEKLETPEGKSTFEAGKDAYFGGLFDQSIQYMDQYLQKNETSKDADAKEVAEAVYIRGESYYKQKQYKKAIVDFSKFPEKFQKSPYHPKALLRIAESFEALGMKDDAKIFYSDLSEKFPKTAEGKLAVKRLKIKKK